MVFPVLPRIPVQLILWQGDEELPPESTILFDATISDYLPAGLEYVSSQIYGVAPYTSAVGINGINQFVEYS